MIIEGNFSYFSLKSYVVTPHLNRRDEKVQMSGHNVCFYVVLTKIIPNYHQILLPIESSEKSTYWKRAS